MSEIGLQSGVYSQLCDYADAINEFLVDVKSAAAFPPAPQQLVDFIDSLHREATTGLAVRALSRQLRWSQLPVSRLGQLAEALREKTCYPELISDLELLASELRKQQAGAYARLRRP
jgi:hypothetical protein